MTQNADGSEENVDDIEIVGNGSADEIVLVPIGSIVLTSFF